MDLFPYWFFAPVDDDRTPADCRALIGVVRYKIDPFWKDHPCGRAGCRCTRIELNERALARLNRKVEKLPPAVAAPEPPPPVDIDKLPPARRDFLRWLNKVIASRKP